MTSERYHTISKENPAFITVWRDAYATQSKSAKTIKFTSARELAKFFNRPPLIRGRKRDVPLFSRARCEGPRLKENLRPPFLLILDVDKSETPLQSCSHRLGLLGVAHVGYETWSHGRVEGRHSYRIVTDLVLDDWDSLEAATKELFDELSMKPTHESWHSPVFFVPAVPSDA